MGDSAGEDQTHAAEMLDELAAVVTGYRIRVTGSSNAAIW